jgi:hypothetical protein
MFVFSLLPFSTSDIIYRNGEVFKLLLNINRNENVLSSVSSLIEMALNIETTDIVYRNSDVFELVLSINRSENVRSLVSSRVEMVLNIQNNSSTTL